MNEMKPEDVMRALEAWIYDFNGTAKQFCALCDAITLLREKDAEIERLKNSITFQVTMPDEKVEEIRSACLKRIDELGSQRWISVKDRFPKPYESVLVWGKDTGGVRWGVYSPNQSIWKDGTISHWMQLPKPPKTEDDFPNCKISGCEGASSTCHKTCPHGKEDRDGTE